MTQFTIHLPDNEYQALRTAANRRGESIDKLIARCLALAGVTAAAARPAQERWPPDFFEQTAGCLANDPLQRQPQGEYEQRRELF